MINRIEAACLRRSRVVTALSQYTIDCVGKIHGQELAQDDAVDSGVGRHFAVRSRCENREGAKVQLGWPTDRPTLFTLRRLVSRMGLDRLLKASHQLLEEGLQVSFSDRGNRAIAAQAGGAGECARPG